MPLLGQNSAFFCLASVFPSLNPCLEQSIAYASRNGTGRDWIVKTATFRTALFLGSSSPKRRNRDTVDRYRREMINCKCRAEGAEPGRQRLNVNNPAHPRGIPERRLRAKPEGAKWEAKRAQRLCRQESSRFQNRREFLPNQKTSVDSKNQRYADLREKQTMKS